MSEEHQDPHLDHHEHEEHQDPHLVVTGPEVTDIRRLEVADFRAAFLLRETRLGVVVRVLPVVIQAQQLTRVGAHAGGKKKGHAGRCTDI